MKIGDKVRIKNNIDIDPEVRGLEGTIVEYIGDLIKVRTVNKGQIVLNKFYYELVEEYQPKHMKESVEHPVHYNKGIETIDYIESWEMNFNRGNIIKYVTRSPYKGKELEDLKKARFYLDREIAKLEK